MANHHNNASTVSTSLERGWRDRQSKAQDKSAQTADWREVDRIRQQHFAELDRKAKAEAEERRNRQGLKVACPCCDTGSVSVELAEKVYRALERLPAGSEPDALKLAALVAVASGLPAVESQIVHTSHGLSAPRKVSPPVAMPVHDAPGDDADALRVYMREEAARAAEIVALARPVSDAEAAAVETADHDAVLAEIRAVDPAPVTVTTPTKHRTRRVAPAPFLAGDE